MHHLPTPSLRRLATFGLLLLCLLATGCGLMRRFTGPTGGLVAQSTGAQAVTLAGDFGAGIYSFDDENHVTVLLVEGPLNNPTQAITIRMMWQPSPPNTPVDANATNATIHYMIFTGDQPGSPAGAPAGQVGIYSGAGFLYPRNDPGSNYFSASIWQANLVLADRSANFADLLGPASLRGGFAARRDDLATAEALRQLNARVVAQLQYPRLVSADSR